MRGWTWRRPSTQCTGQSPRSRRTTRTAAGARPRSLLFTSGRQFLPGEDAPWIEEERRRLDQIRLRALAAEGNVAEALQEYDRLRVLLHDELGVAPSPPTQEVHKVLLG